MRILVPLLLFILPLFARNAVSAVPKADSAVMDRDLIDVTVDQLHKLYGNNRYTVTQVGQWHLDRIARYNGIYRAVQTVNAQAALAQADREDAEARKPGFKPSPLWGVPI